MSRLGDEAMVEKIGNRRNSSSSSSSSSPPEWLSSEWSRASPGDSARKPEDAAEPRLRGMATGDGVEMDDAGEEMSPMVAFEAGSEAGSG